MKAYEVTGLTKKGGERKWCVGVEADNAKVAKELARDMWGSNPRLRVMHLFDVKVHVAKVPTVVYGRWVPLD